MEELESYLTYGCFCDIDDLLKFQAHIRDEMIRLQVTKPALYPIFPKCWDMGRQRWSPIIHGSWTSWRAS